MGHAALLLGLACLFGALLIQCLILGAKTHTQLRHVCGTKYTLAGYIIHLADRRDRLNNVRSLVNAAARAGVELNVFAGCDGRHRGRMQVAPFFDMTHAPGVSRSYLRGGEQGCLESSLAVWSLLAEEGGGFCIEDDAIMDTAGFLSLCAAFVSVSGAWVLHGQRTMPNGLAHARTADAEKHALIPMAGWRPILGANYSNALFAIKPTAAVLLRDWLQQISGQGMHLLPADDLLSVACSAHEGLQLAPMNASWAHQRLPSIRAAAPVVPLSHRLYSQSDTE
jgi:hypothetical protein